MSKKNTRIFRSFLFACAFAGVSALASTSSVNALPAGVAGAVNGEVSSLALFHQAQFRGRRGGARRGGVRRGGGVVRRGGGVRRGAVIRGGRTPGGRARVRRNRALGAAAAIGVGAALLGAIAAGSARPRGEVVTEEPVYVRRRPAYGSDVEYCMRRFRSYNPDTGLYRGFDGRLHPCP